MGMSQERTKVKGFSKFLLTLLNTILTNGGGFLIRIEGLLIKKRLKMSKINLLISFLFFVTVSCGQNNKQKENSNYNVVLGEKHKNKNLEA